MIRRPPRSTLSSSSAASDVYKRQVSTQSTGAVSADSMASFVLEPRTALGEFPEEPYTGTSGTDSELRWSMGLYGGVDIQNACDKLYGQDVHPFPQFMALQKYHLGGPDPLDYTNAYSTLDGKCWHYVSMGMSNLHREVYVPHLGEGLNGFGFELTLRATKMPGEDTAPIWVFALMQKLARHCFQNHRGFKHGHAAPVGPLVEGSTMNAVLFARDPQLECSETTRGRVEFLTMVGVTGAEFEAAINVAIKTGGDAGVGGFLHVLQEFIGEDLPTDLHRKCLMANPEFVAKVEALTSEVEAT
eukprot:TRINITY_DN2399_c0_g3_i1.p1 TRINITY_DN2399_c0_g3~~TRINITY_DN2399_c0_g3_i1.p1  ORF type:complete len:301 (+),score=67.61 TRINITY_DN2399_c0_g3_i1:94-996(+)